MNILVTGNLGYVGSILTEDLLDSGYNVVGLDYNYFKDCVFLDKKNNFKQIFRDIRKIEINDLENIDAIIHLAGLSNDPLGDLDEKLTMDINYKATVRLAELAKKKKVKKFLYASTQSLYGISNTDHEINEDNGAINPLTAYAISKWKSEKELLLMSSDTFSITILRPSTVFGFSPRLRCDIVFNNLMACAYTTNNVEILTDGSPWRPVLHVKDLSSGFKALLAAPVNLIMSKVYNIGSHEGNFMVKDLADIVQKKIKSSKITYLNNHVDPRSYKVSFKKIFDELSYYYTPKFTLDYGADELINFFKTVNFSLEDFRGYKTNRLKNLQKLLISKKLDKNLVWVG